MVATVKISLPRPLNVPVGGTRVTLPRGNSTTQVRFMTAAGSGGCTEILVEITIADPCTWARSLSGEVLPLLDTGSGGMHPAADATETLAWLLEFASLEAAQPYVHDDFIDAVKTCVRSVSGTDSDGVELVDSPVPALPVFTKGAYSGFANRAYVFPSPLAARALPALAARTGPHWEYWQIGYYVSLRTVLNYGHLTRLLREAVTSLQTAMEAAMIAVQGWPETQPYGDATIGQFPPAVQARLRSLLLTRNLMLHRGQVALKVMRPGEAWKAASARPIAQSDGTLTDTHVLEFADACFEALLFLETPGTKVT